MKNVTTKTLIFMSLSIVLNFMGCFIALMLKLPIYLDSMGTLLTAVMMGPFCGAVVGGLTALLNGITIDPISFYFLPVQMMTGIVTGLLFRKGSFEGLRSILAIILVALLVAVMSSLIVAFIFEGVSSSGSSLIVALLSNSGVDLFVSVFSTQIVTDLLDKAVCFGVVFAVIKVTPLRLKNEFVSH